ncbi:nickel insertion protein [Carboxylicivirga sp. M1479]|uniref:nickel insertion protein n=1 Tax=Carboxylicivirga sp. M1479 TaxID=2594476 RepID=UPI001178087A|nr:nickel insertion protein [Carboxylicivirga sp. M1479]TRX71231.1 LarC family nickel insertion protein [Carboxylicivirga sp. M1479]
MQLYIDPKGGIAGDMFAAALISAGANEEEMLKAMSLAAEKIGHSTISTSLTHDNAHRLHIDIQHNDGHLSGHKAYHLLEDIFAELNIKEPYQQFGFKALDVLVKAEIKAHKENTFLTDHIHAHHHHHHDSDHEHEHHEDAYLHEAQDILIDITGAAMGLQLLNAPIKAYLLSPVSFGGGHITFSHGHLPVPAPATKIIFDNHGLPGTMGPIEKELCTPTGSAILAALNAELMQEKASGALQEGTSRGGKDFDIPPLKVLLA